MIWYVLQTRPGCEHKALAELRRLGIESYAPMETVWRQSARRRERSKRPYIRGYVFALLGDEQFAVAAHEVHGIAGVVSLKASAAQIEAFVRLTRQAEFEGAFDQTRKLLHGFSVGQPIRLSDPRKWYDGLIGTVKHLKGQRRASVLIAAIGRFQVPRPVDVDCRDMQPVAA